MTPISESVKLLAAILSIGGISYRLAAYANQRRWKPRPIDKPEDLFILSYLLLRLDQISVTGLWGRSISKYLRINFPNDAYIKARLGHYRETGSITHTAHALKALCSFYSSIGHKPSIEVDTLQTYLCDCRQPSGIFHPEHKQVVNLDEASNFAHELRHNSTALTCLHFLKGLNKDDTSSLRQYSEWIAASLDFVICLPHERLWLTDPQYGHSLAYMVQCFDILRQDDGISDEHRKLMDKYVGDGVNAMIDRLENGYWLARTHSKTKCFYTLLILEILLRAQTFVLKDENLRLSFDILQNLSKMRGSDLGLSLGALGDKSKFSFGDVGTTARFAVATDLLGKQQKTGDVLTKGELELLYRWQRESIDFVRINCLSLLSGSYNAMTHSFESVLGMLDLYRPLDLDYLRSRILRADEIVNAFLESQSSLKNIDLSGISNPLFVQKIVARDMIHLPSSFLKKCGFVTYWA